MAVIRNLKWILICLSQSTVTPHLGTIWIAAMNTFLGLSLYLLEPFVNYCLPSILIWELIQRKVSSYNPQVKTRIYEIVSQLKMVTVLSDRHRRRAQKFFLSLKFAVIAVVRSWTAGQYLPTCNSQNWMGAYLLLSAHWTHIHILLDQTFCSKVSNQTIFRLFRQHPALIVETWTPDIRKTDSSHPDLWGTHKPGVYWEHWPIPQHRPLYSSAKKMPNQNLMNLFYSFSQSVTISPRLVVLRLVQLLRAMNGCWDVGTHTEAFFQSGSFQCMRLVQLNSVLWSVINGRPNGLPTLL